MLDVIFQHCYVREIDMLHGSTNNGYLFFQFKPNFDNYNDCKFMCEIDNI